jgi:hypothetical protein
VLAAYPNAGVLGDLFPGALGFKLGNNGLTATVEVDKLVLVREGAPATLTGWTYDFEPAAPAAASVTATGGTPQSATINTAFASPLTVTVRDAASQLLSGVTVTFALPASGPGGTFGGAAAVVTDSTGAATSPTVTANGLAGSYNPTATAGQASAIFALTNTQAATTTGLGASPNPSIFGQAVTFTATVNPAAATGTVTFMDGATTLGTGTVTNGIAAFTTSSSLLPGTHAIAANYGGDGNYLPSTGLLTLTVGPALTGVQRTFVASMGDDAALCSIAAPCRSFAAAILRTTPGGEIIVQDSAGYGPVVVTRPVSIIAPPGVYAGISVFSGSGIVVNPGSGRVTLRGLTINGLGGNVGIHYQTGDALYVDRTVVTGFGNTGLQATLGSGGALFVSDSTFRDNLYGALLAPSSAGLQVRIARSRFERNATGIGFTGSGTTAVIQDSLVNEGTIGVNLQASATGAVSNVLLRGSTIAKNAASGIRVGGGGGGGHEPCALAGSRKRHGSRRAGGRHDVRQRRDDHPQHGRYRQRLGQRRVRRRQPPSQ